MNSTPAMVNWIQLALCNSAASPDRVFGGIVCQERASVAQRFSSRRRNDSSCAGESLGVDRSHGSPLGWCFGTCRLKRRQRNVSRFPVFSEQTIGRGEAICAIILLSLRR
jgi:hypothetical protein